ncbi:TadE/TadG family type IV pilus assembly protein [Desulfurispora thermophila]|uniref:TadE/TadG family type IV pilus assembly protein n=1 Tax=Desulfurispora thermophila TaxID=265470 RepID=UPI00035FC705|nr:TadE/TadG family type IV pilus assembly protein [Desulfurispora thermophila]
MLKRLQQLGRSQRGQTLVEMAIILPLLILLLMATIEFGRIFFTYLSITNATREAARSTVISEQKDDAAIRQRVLDAASWLTAQNITVEVSPASVTNRTSGVPLTITVTYPVVLYTPVLSQIISNPFTVSAQTTMRIE